MSFYKYLIILLPFLIWGCKDQEKSAYLEEIEVMTSKIDSLDIISKNQNSDSIPQVVKTIEKTIDKVKSNYVADTIDLELAALMNRYKDAKKSLSSNTGNLSKAKGAIPEVKEKLEHLKHDIENGVGDREKYQEYINFEKNKIQEIESILSYYIKTNKKYLKQFKNDHPQVKSFVDSLVSQNAK
jgi:chromosome segregation ATPase